MKNLFLLNFTKACHPALDAGSPEKRRLIIRGLRVKPAMTDSSKTTFETAFLGILFLFLTALPLTAQVTTRDNVPYIVPGMTTSLSANGVTVITGSADISNPLTSGWYLFEGTFSYSGTITISGNVNLILADGCNVTVTATGTGAGIDVEGSNSLTVYGQSAGTGTLTANGAGGGAGIGGKGGVAGANGAAGGTITINGGTINATGSTDGEGGGAGIGGGGGGSISGNATDNGGSGGIIIINGGTINATGGDGGGSGSGVGNENGGSGAGIGGGGAYNGGSGGSITISGGSITAQGGNSNGGGAGIGGGGCDHSGSGGTPGSAGTIFILTDMSNIHATGGGHSNGNLVPGASIGAGGGASGSGAGASSYTTNASTNTQYISVTQTTGGTIYAVPSGATGGATDPVKVNSGASQYFVIVPNSDYALISVTVDGNLVSGAPTSYTFTSVTVNTHTITATFAKKQ